MPKISFSAVKLPNRVKIFLNILTRFAAAIVTIAMLLIALMVVLHRESLTLDPLRRWAVYGSMKTDSEGQTEEFSFYGDNSNAYASVGGGLLVCSKTSLQVYSASGHSVLSTMVDMDNPVIDVSGDCAVVYDVGGQELYQFSGTEKVFSYTAKDSAKLLSARVNSAGYLSVVEQTAGHEAAVTVYDAEHRPLIGINETTNFVTDAILAPNNHYVALFEVYHNNGETDTNLVIYRLSDAHILSTCKLEQELVLDAKWDSDRIWIQQEAGITLCDKEGTILGSWHDTGKYLEGYSLAGNGYAVEILSRYKSGSSGDLRIIDKDGQTVVSRRIQEEVLSVSASGDYIAVLTTKDLTVYQGDLQLYASVSNSSTRHVIIREDGSAMMIGTDTAKLLLP